MRELDVFSAEARGDVVQVLLAALRTAQGEWGRFRGVPLRWVVLDGSTESAQSPERRLKPGRRQVRGQGRGQGQVRVQKPTHEDLAVDWDRLRGEDSFWPAAHAKARTCRCAALVYGNALPSRTWGGLGVLVGLLYRELPVLDGEVRVLVEHRTGERASFGFPITYRRVPFRRLVYVEDVRTLLRRASEG